MFISDTHSLIWYLTEDSKLGKKALKIFEASDSGKETIIIPTIVLAELLHICEKKKIGVKFNHILEKLKDSLNYVVYNLDFNIILKIKDLTKIPDLHDRIIVATARIIKAKVITKDTIIKKSNYVNIIW